MNKFSFCENKNWNYCLRTELKESLTSNVNEIIISVACCSFHIRVSHQEASILCQRGKSQQRETWFALHCTAGA